VRYLQISPPKEKVMGFRLRAQLID